MNVFLSLGANLGNPFKTLLQAIDLITDIKGVHFIDSSPVYKTSPVSDIPQDDFLNLVCHIQTDLSPFSLFNLLEEIEKKLGKKQKKKNEPRLIDIDILFFGTEKIETQTLTIPHKEWKSRLFVLIPLLDLIDKIQVPLKDQIEIIDLKEIVKSFPHHQKISFFKHLERPSCKTLK